MSFELGEPKQSDDIFFDRKSHAHVDRPDENGFPSDITHKDLFDTISEAHYLPELGGPHDEELLESLVEKGCEDNQILGQALDKLAHLVHGSGDYAEEEDDMLLGNAPVSDIIDRLEQSLESPGRSSITAAQSLLHLHSITDHLPTADHQHSVEDVYMPNEVYAPQTSSESTLNTHTDASHVAQMEYVEQNNHIEETTQNDAGAVNEIMYTEQVPDVNESYAKPDENHQPLMPDQSVIATPSDMSDNRESENISADSEHISDSNQPNSIENNAVSIETVDFKELEETSDNNEELVPTDLSIKHTENNTASMVGADVTETSNVIEDNVSDKSDEQPRDLTMHRRLPTPHASPRRIDIPRAPSRESDAMQSPQPSGIPAVPSSPEIFTVPHTKSKQTLFLEALLSSPSPKMYTSEVTITKQQNEPLNLGKHRKSASPTVSSCSDEMKKINKEYGEPQEKKVKKEDEDLVKITKVFGKPNDDSKNKKRDKPATLDESSPIKQFLALKTSPTFNIPDPMLIPKDKLSSILLAPAKEIPALLIQRPELRLPEAFNYPSLLQDPDIIVIGLKQLESIIAEGLYSTSKESKEKEPKENKKSDTSTKAATASSTSSNSECIKERGTPNNVKDKSQLKAAPSMDSGDIDAATLGQMMYFSNLEAAYAQNMEMCKAFASYPGLNYPSELSQMLMNHPGRFMGPTGFPMMSAMDYENQMRIAMTWEMMKQQQANASASQRSNSNLEAQLKELASKSNDVQNPYVHSTKSTQSKSHTSARTSPIAHNYNTNQRIPQNPFLQGMYPGMNPNMRSNMPLPGLQIPYFNPSMMGSQRSPRTSQQKSPTSPFYPNNNYLHSVKQSEGHGHQRSSSAGSQESPRPKISVKALHNLMDPSTAAAAAAAAYGRGSGGSSSSGRRREEPEVGSTTPCEPPPHMPPHPHDPASFHLWHPLFGNQKGYASPWNWTQVTATGD